MSSDMWNARAEIAQARARAKPVQGEIKKLDRSAARYVERLLDAQSGAVVRASRSVDRGGEDASARKDRLLRPSGGSSGFYRRCK